MLSYEIHLRFQSGKSNREMKKSLGEKNNFKII